MNKLFNIWEALLVPFDVPSPFNNMYETIDSTLYSNVWWQSFSICYNLHNDLPVMKLLLLEKQQNMIVGSVILGKSFTICLPTGDSIRNLTMYIPYQEYDFNGQHLFHDVFSGNWCWCQAISMLTIMCTRLLFDILIYFAWLFLIQIVCCIGAFLCLLDGLTAILICWELTSTCTIFASWVALEDVVHTWHHISKVA